MRRRRPFSSERFGPFRGRTDEIAKLRSMLAGPAPIITVTGLPGVGKTRLVAHVVGDDAVWLLASDIEDAGTFGPVVERCAVEIGPHGRHGDGPMTVVIDGLERPDLIVPLAEFVDDHPMLRVVATSRVHLGMRGAASIRLTPFELPTRAASLVATPERWPAVQCFVDRAAAVDPGFRVTPDTATPVLDLLRATGGLPLAIELATAWLGVLPISSLSWAVTDPGSLNERGPLDLEPSQRDLTRTLRSAVAHIPPRTREVAQAIAEFHGAAPLPAIAFVLGTDVTAELLVDLLQSNLVWSVDVLHLPHLTMLPAVARELRADRTDTVFRDRYLAWLTEFVEHHASALGGSGHGAAVAALAPVIDSLPDLREVYPRGDDRAAAVTLALLPYWRMSAQFRESRRRIDAALTLIDDTHPLSAWLTLASARAHRDCGDMTAAERIATDIESDPHLPAVLRAAAAAERYHLFQMSAVVADNADFTTWWREAATSNDPTPAPRCVDRWASSVPIVAQIEAGDRRCVAGDFDEACEAYLAAIDMATAGDELMVLSWALYAFAEASRAAGRDLDGDAAIDRQWDVTRLLGERSPVHLHSGLVRAQSLAAQGEHAAARAIAHELLDSVDELEAPFFIEQMVRVVGSVLAEVGDDETARRALARSLAICNVMDERARTPHAIAAVALAAPPVGPDAATRTLLLAAAAAHDADAIPTWGPWKARADALDLGHATSLSLAEACVVASAVLETAAPASPAPGIPIISRREHEVLMMLVDGLTDREIAARLIVSIRTAEAHVGAILRKLGTPNRRAAAEMGRQAGLGILDSPPATASLS